MQTSAKSNGNKKKEKDIQAIKEFTVSENNFFIEELSCYDIEVPYPEYDIQRYCDIKQMTKLLSRNKRSVIMAHFLLNAIFNPHDVETLKNRREDQVNCIQFKFKALEDLAITLKMTTKDLVLYCPDSICGKMVYLLILNGTTVHIIERYIGYDFFIQNVLSRAWYYLLQEQKINFEILQETLLKIQVKDKKAITLKHIKENLFEFLAKVSFTSKLQYSQKKNLLQMAKNTFGFQNDQEIVNLYNSLTQQQVSFESLFLKTLMKRLSFGKKYFLEKLMEKNDKQFVLNYYMKKDYIQQEFFNKKAGSETARKTKKFIEALEFINKEIKKGASLTQSDFVVCFLNAFNGIFAHDFKSKDVDEMKRQSELIQFVLTVEILIKNNLAEDEYFKQALVAMSIYVLKLGIENEHTVEISIYSMQIILNAIGLKDSIHYLNKFCSIAVQAYLKFPDSSKIKKYIAKIINFYIKDKARFTQSYFRNLQFIFIKKLKEIPALSEAITLISFELYKSQDEIAENLKYLVSNLQYGNLDIKILNTTYILELLEQEDQKHEVRMVLVSPEILKIVYQGILEMRQDYKTEKSKRLAIICAKCVAAIGLCQPFVNDPLTLKATNQITLVGKKRQMEAQKQDENNPSGMNSDYYNPLTNMKYKNQEQDNTLETLAVPSFEDLQIERKDVIKFAEQLLAKLHSITNVTDSKPQIFYYSLFLIDMFINQQKIQTQTNTTDDLIKEKYFKQKQLSTSITRYSSIDLTQYQQFSDPNQPEVPISRYTRRLCLYLITKIQQKEWRELFEVCVPIIKNVNEVLEMILPYIMYYAIRFNSSDLQLPDQIANIMNTVLSSEFTSQIVPILKTQDFIKICCQQDKKAFKHFIENDTKFKYVEKLFHIDFDITKIKDQNVINFIKTIEQQPLIKHSFCAVKKIRSLLSQIDKTKKIQGSKKVKAYQRCVFSFEEQCRPGQNQVGKGFMDILQKEDTIEIVHLHRQLNPEDFDYGIFNSISNSSKNHEHPFKDVNEIGMSIDDIKNAQTELQQKQMNQQKLKALYASYNQNEVHYYWKNGKWDQLQEWASDVDLSQFDEFTIFLDRELDNPIEKFEFLISLFSAEFSKGIKHLLSNDECVDNQQYLKSLSKINHFFELLYLEFILSLDEQQGEISYFYKLFLHVMYEIESAVHYLKDVFFLEKDRLSEILKKEVNKDKRSFEKIYYEFDMSQYFEKLLSWFEERTQMLESSTESLKLIYFVRRMIFKMFDRENEYAYYLMRLAKLFRKTSNDVLEINTLFKDCETLQHKIIDYELEYAKYTLKTKNAHEAFQYIMSKQDLIKQKCDELYKATKFHWMPQRVYDKAMLLSIELQIKIDPQNPQILKRFDEFLKSLEKNRWEKPLFRFAQYLDELDVKAPSIQQQVALDQSEIRKRWIQKIYYYIFSLKHGHKYIWQSFPRALELWFEYNEKEQDIEKINRYVRQELLQLEVFKLASVLQIFLSRFAHCKEQVRETIIQVLSKIAIQYPGQCAWWIFHFLHFELGSVPGGLKRVQNAAKTIISRAEFAKQLIAQIGADDEKSQKKILECEKIFLEMTKYSSKQVPQNCGSTMELSQFLQNIKSSNLVMPIEQNLSPQLPPTNYKANYIMTSLSCTTTNICLPNPRNANIHNNSNQGLLQDNQDTNSLQDFPAFKKNPVTISGFLHEATIMVSKERPKKIGIIGSNKQVYNFLLKCDLHGDLRKEQRFIDFAVLCNKMLENDSEARKRNLRLRTYAIVPLSRSTGLIEWIQNTTTLKSIVGEQWKKNNIKGEMQDIKAKAIALKSGGETHELIWNVLKEEIKPVLGHWMADHFPSPEIWYEARINFIRSTAIWSMIGYVIGLGDRHGDNILIHQHTGEVTHVDFDCIFEKGAKLKIPEIVPFRLTQNIMDAFGIFKEKGVFQRTCEVVQRVLRKNSKNIISFLDSFIHDPLIESTQNIKVEIKQALEIVKQKLYGQIKGDQGGSITIEEQVEQVILHAINDDSLRKMYIGWMPWL